MAEIFAYASNALILTQGVGLQPTYAQASNRLVFNQDVTTNIKFASASNRLVLTQNLYLNKVLNITVQQRFVPNSTTARTEYQHVYQSFFMWHEASRVFTADNFLAFSQNLTQTLGKGSLNTLTFHQTATFNITKGLNAYNSIVFKQFAHAIIEKVGFIAEPVAILADVYTGLTFGYAGHIIHVRAPDFDNTNRLNWTRINRRSRGGDLQVFRDPIWPLNESFLMKWSTLKESELNDLLLFSNGVLGLIIDFQDYEGRVFKGIISGPVKGGQQGRELWNAEMEFTILYELTDPLYLEHSKFVIALYDQVLRRVPSDDEVAVWNNYFLHYGRDGTVQGIITSVEATILLINSWYIVYLLRTPSVEEIQGYIDNLIRGDFEEHNAGLILSSPEAYGLAQTWPSTTGSPNDKYIEYLYLVILNRFPSVPEIQQWEPVTADNIYNIAFDIYRSAESRRIVVQSYYTYFLGRSADAGELDYWALSILPIHQVRRFILDSEEYYFKVTR